MENLTLHPKFRQQIVDSMYERYQETGILEVENAQEFKAMADNDLLSLIMPELNDVSDKYIRDTETYRREEDADELAVALSLFVFKMKLFLESKGITVDLTL